MVLWNCLSGPAAPFSRSSLVCVTSSAQKQPWCWVGRGGQAAAALGLILVASEHGFCRLHLTMQSKRLVVVVLTNSINDLVIDAHSKVAAVPTGM